ncbi:hypothetical protein CFC21_049396 [Triticum aestivum]|uniref:Uncharacterized protein n=3 Tax=Triticinae TaxID=1648030 RepID=A0A453GB63_AEGTS|nr:uncharacterized protein LOC109743685 isoform X1 [Aegilops tauschii subsp. strangulata]XP_044353825.1 uncharacterized protein LOC123075232 isoform X1 [Triticum aestivum]KAF7039394.1 hypothetical protein CFC21_049396 [Triticum aestivum]
MASPSLLTVHLRGSASPPDAASSVAIEVEGGDGVDLAQVGLALGLDPATVGLNGYFLSCGSGYVSLAVTWGELLAFFATGGQPTGADPAEPVAVDGGPVPSPPEPRVVLSSKRKPGLETENCSKKSKLQHNSSAQSKAGEELLADEITFGLKRRLTLDEASPSKKIKQVDSVEAQQPVKYSCSFASSHDKRPSDEEMVISLSRKGVW